jgi:hypothetical protein
VTKVVAAVLLSLGFCLPCWAGRNATSEDRNAIKEQIREAVRDLQAQLPELLKAVRVTVQVPDLHVQILEIKVQLPEILTPAIKLQIPVRVQIPEIRVPEISIEIPKLDIRIDGWPE